MSNNKQSSSIDWLINEHFGGMENCTPDFRYKIEQAKAMHKEEIRKAYCYGEYYKDAKLTTDYYNETFGGNNDKQ